MIRNRFGPTLWQGVLLVIAGLSGLMVWAAGQAGAVPRLAFGEAPCTAQPVWQVLFPNDGASVVPRGDGWDLRGQGAIGAQVCRAGVLHLTGNGDQAEGPPELTVLLDGEVLAIESFPVARTVQVRVPRGGALHLAYLNDLYRSEVRLGILADVRLNAQSCRLLEVVVPPENGGGYSPIPRVATLVGPQPATVTPCHAGELSFTVAGRKAQGAFPRIRVEQGGQVLAEVRATGQDQRLNVPVSAEPVRFRLLNPYARELADRNLFLRGLRWQAD